MQFYFVEETVVVDERPFSVAWVKLLVTVTFFVVWVMTLDKAFCDCDLLCSLDKT